MSALPSAGYSARAQDASTVLTNPAGMTRLAGDQFMLGAQVLYGDLGFSIGQGTTPALGGDAGGNPVGWFPGGGLFYSHSVSPDFKLGLALTGNFGSAVKYDDGWVGRYRAQEGTLLGVLDPAVDRVAHQREPLAGREPERDGTASSRTRWPSTTSSGPMAVSSLDDNAWGFGANLGLLYEVDQRHALRHHLHLAGQARLQRAAAVERPRARHSGPARVARAARCQDVDLGVTVPQGVNASFYHEIDPRWAVLGSVGWQQWSKFGEVEVGSRLEQSRRADHPLNFKDTWHLAGGAQYKWSDAWLLNAGIAYDSGFQDNNAVALALPANAAWRFGIGGQKEESKAFNWGLSLEYLHGGTLHSNIAGSAPVALGGRGDVVGSFNNVAFYFLAANGSWKF